MVLLYTPLSFQSFYLILHNIFHLMALDKIVKARSQFLENWHGAAAAGGGAQISY